MESYFEYFKGVFLDWFGVVPISLAPQFQLSDWIFLPLEEHLENSNKVILFSVAKSGD